MIENLQVAMYASAFSVLSLIYLHFFSQLKQKHLNKLEVAENIVHLSMDSSDSIKFCNNIKKSLNMVIFKDKPVVGICDRLMPWIICVVGKHSRMAQ